MQPKVWNKHLRNAPSDTVYIGRGSPWGNPFIIPQHGTRAEVIEKYGEYIRCNPEVIKMIKQELKGKHLVCFCSPLPCHGDVLLRIANEE